VISSPASAVVSIQPSNSSFGISAIRCQRDDMFRVIPSGSAVPSRDSVAASPPECAMVSARIAPPLRAVRSFILAISFCFSASSW
jgi:hypothetical protein